MPDWWIYTVQCCGDGCRGMSCAGLQSKAEEDVASEASGNLLWPSRLFTASHSRGALLRSVDVYSACVYFHCCHSSECNRLSPGMSRTAILAILLFAMATCAIAEIADTQRQHNQFELHDKDIQDAKERWIQEEDWGDDMMQHPIDEGPRRVSASAKGHKHHIWLRVQRTNRLFWARQTANWARCALTRGTATRAAAS